MSFSNCNFIKAILHPQLHPYEPNNDNMNTDISKGPCSVQADYWEYDLKKGIVIRHHCRPRSLRFHPAEAHDRPDSDGWLSHRVTLVSGFTCFG